LSNYVIIISLAAQETQYIYIYMTKFHIAFCAICSIYHSSTTFTGVMYIQNLLEAYAVFHINIFILLLRTRLHSFNILNIDIHF
jgi:hypothetical protein